MSKSKGSKKKVNRLTPNQLMSMGKGFAVIDKINIDKVQKQRSFVKEEIKHIYEMSKKFISNDVKAYVDQKLQDEKQLIDRFPNAQTIPYHITIGAYGYQELAIALILCHVETPEAWSFESIIYLEQEDEYQITEAVVNYSRSLPAMTHIEFLRGKKDCKIEHGHGLKTIGWKGFETEILKELESHKDLRTDFSIKRIEVVLNADIKFLNTAAYEEFIRIQNWVNAGHIVAESKLRDLWISEQEAGSKAKLFGYGEVA